MSDASDLLGLGGSLPGPGWAVLDAARDQRFTGELIAEADGTVRVYFDRGRVYVAERATDPSLGTRLVEAGALNRAQLDYGTLRVGDIDHLGRLFDRVPSVNRDGVLVLNELMTDECVRWLAGRQVRSVVATPYRHHPSGMHRWELFGGPSTPGSSTVPDMALPAPDPGATPIAADPPPDQSAASAAPRPEPSPAHDAAPARPRSERFELDDVVAWNEPSPILAGYITTTVGATSRHGADLVTPADRWIDELDHDGVPHADQTGAPPRLSPLPVRQTDGFELIWPSGETFDVADPADPNHADADADRGAPAARVATSGDVAEPATAPDADGGPDDAATSDTPSPLAVRRAVATIDTGSLEARRRLVDVSSEATAPPGRLVVQRETSVWRSDSPTPTSSVFDELPVEPVEAEPEASADDDHQGRSNALRRLIDSLRRP